MKKTSLTDCQPTVGRHVNNRLATGVTSKVYIVWKYAWYCMFTIAAGFDCMAFLYLQPEKMAEGMLLFIQGLGLGNCFSSLFCGRSCQYFVVSA